MSATSQEHHIGALEEYAHLKLELASIVRALLHVAERRKHDRAIGEIRRLLARLAEDRFNLAVVGQFSRGKSSLMNAILGAPKLPTGVLPLTSVITTVTYGEKERVLLQREGWTLPQEIPLKQLADSVTQDTNPSNEKRVTLAEIQLPNEMLRLGIHFIDTPGVASTVAANSRTTREFLPEVDAAIVVTSFESPMTDAEVEFLRDVRQQIRKVFVVVNKLDLVTQPERTSALDSVKALIRDAVPGEPIEVFAVSARAALDAKRQDCFEALTASGLPRLESALTQFLRREKAQELLLRAADRAAATARQQMLAIRIAQRALSEAESERLKRRLEGRIWRLNADRDSLVARMRAELPSEFLTRCAKPMDVWTSADENRLVSDLRAQLGSMESRGRNFNELLANACKKLYEQWLGRCQDQIDRQFPELTHVYNAALDTFVERSNSIPAELLDDIYPGGKTSVACYALTAPLMFRGFSITLDRFAEPWWFQVLGPGRLRRFLVERWLRKMPELARAHLGALTASLQFAASDWIDQVDRELTDHIESVRQHITKLLMEPPQPADLSEVEGILERLQAFVRSVRGSASGELSHSEPMVLAAPTSKRAGSTSQCPVCLKIERALFDFLAHRQYELSVNEGEQRRHALRLGFCPLHTWQFEAVASPQGICAGYPALLIHLAKDLRSLAENGGSCVSSVKNGVRSLLADNESCPACKVAAATEAAAAQEIASQAERDDKSTAGLCMHHLHSTLHMISDLPAARRLLWEQSSALEAIAEDMQNYVLKQDATRHHLWTNAERQAAVTGLMRLVGRRNTVAPWRTE